MNIKILRMPTFRGSNAGASYFPPLGMVHIFTYLKERGYNIQQEDIGVSGCRYRSFLNNALLRRRISGLIFNHKKLLNFIENGDCCAFIARHFKGILLDSVDVLMLSVYSSDSYSSTVAIMIGKYFKTINPSGTVIIGGEWDQNPFIYDCFSGFHAAGALDYYILGAGEISADKLLRFIGCEPIDLNTISGLVYMKNGTTVKVAHSSHYQLLKPSFTGLALDRYRWRPFGGGEGILVLPMQIIRGCPNKCSFCPSSTFSGLECLKPADIVSHLKDLSISYNTNYFLFMADTINISQDFINDLCDRILESKLNIRWSSCMHFRCMDDEALLKKLYAAGARRLIFGVETASEKLSRLIGKGVDKNQAARVLRHANNAGIWTELEIICGLPHENESDILETQRFILDNKYSINGLYLNRFFLSRTSLMAADPLKYGITNIRSISPTNSDRAKIEERQIFEFDEIDGFSWPQKKIQIEQSYQRMMSFAIKNNICSAIFDSEMNILFYLYERFREKCDIERTFRRYRDRMIFFKKVKYFVGNFFYA